MLNSGTSERLRQAVLRKTPVLMRETTLSLHDKARMHTASLTCYGLEVLLTYFYSRDVALCDFHLFGSRKKRLAGMRFTEDIDVKQAVTSWLQTLDTHFFYIARKPCCHSGQRDDA
jgi:hypothetical protein